VTETAVKVDASEKRPHSADELDARARQILRAVVQEYVETGEPVASGQLARQRGIVLSPASVRAVLADLEALGFIDKPHTSAGRVPTDKGYRFYADALVRVRQLPGRDKERIDQQYDGSRSLATHDVLVTDTSRLLHDLTRHAGVVSTPRDGERFRAIDFIRLRDDRVLAVCVTGAGAVKNRLLTVDFAVDQEDLNRASRYLNDLLSSVGTLSDVRETLARELQSDRVLYDELAARALVLGARALDVGQTTPDIVVEGETSLLSDRVLAEDLERLRAMVRALDEKQRLVGLLGRVAEAKELTLFIGAETGLGAEGLAIVASPYRRGDDVLGAIGVIGPSRMAYGRVIPIVEYTALALSRTLEDG
jgi:heat-inducible transcriptional repressor